MRENILARFITTFSFRVSDLIRTLDWRTAHIRAYIPVKLRLLILRRIVFIGITGSAGKTTTKDITAFMLSAFGSCHKSSDTYNDSIGVAWTVRETTREHRYCVIEASGQAPNFMSKCLRYLRPEIAIVTNIGEDHLSAFGSVEGIAAEKSKLVHSLPAHGIAILNIDDTLVRAMAECTEAEIIWIGKAEGATLRLCEVRSQWPEPLTLVIENKNQIYKVKTQLYATHLALSVLAALAVAVAVKLPFEDAIRALAKASPTEGRMQVIEDDNGIVFIRDDFKAPLWTIPTCIEVLKNATVDGRKICVLGTLSDTGPGTGSPKKYRGIAKQIAEIVDVAIFVGPMAHSALSLKNLYPQKEIYTFSNIQDAAEFFKKNVSSGDLVLLKGTNKQDHLSRIFLAQSETVGCWRNTCRIENFCKNCGLLKQDLSEKFILKKETLEDAAVWFQEFLRDYGNLNKHQIIVGLGNPGIQYSWTPHNAGYLTVISLAEKYGLAWTSMPLGQLAVGRINGQKILLLQPGFNINNSGSVLSALASLTNINIQTCILVHDVLELSFGEVKVRNKGGDGGHKGVASILDIVQTEKITRVKIGVRSPTKQSDLSKYVLSEIKHSERENYMEGIQLASQRLEGLL